MKRLLAASALLTLAVSPAPTLANPFETQLANGLRVIVKEDRRAPTAVHMVWYRAGSMDEKDGTSGVAHALVKKLLAFDPVGSPGDQRASHARRTASSAARSAGLEPDPTITRAVRTSPQGLTASSMRVGCGESPSVHGGMLKGRASCRAARLPRISLWA